MVHAPPCFWNRTRGFLKARRSWELGSSITTIEFSLFHPLRKASAVNDRWTEQDSYLSFSQKSSSWHFLALAKLCSTARVWNHQGISKLVNRVACCLSYDSSLALRSKAIVRALLATNASQRGFQRTHAIYGVCCLSVDSFLALCSTDSADLPCCECSAAGSFVRKVVLLWYCFCCVKESVSGIAFAHGFLVELVS